MNMETLWAALSITGKGLVIVFFVMGLIAGMTWLSGQMFVSLDAKNKKKTAQQAQVGRKPKEKIESTSSSIDGPTAPLSMASNGAPTQGGSS